MPRLSRRPASALIALLLGVVVLPLTLTPTVATAEPDAGPGFSQVPASVASAQVALERAKAVFSGRGIGLDATMALRDLAARLPELSGADRELAEQLLARPNGGKQGVDTQLGAVWPGAEASLSPKCGADLCVHWTDTSLHQPPSADVDLNGIPDQVDDTLREMEVVWAAEVSTLGYRAPLPDQRGSIDNDDRRFDVYLSNVGAKNLYGYCTVDDRHNFRNYDFYDRSGYCVVDDDFVEFPNTPLQNLQVTAAHEFFHAIQFAYDAYEDPWFMEGTAAWVEDEVYDDVNDNLQYLNKSPMAHPEKPLDTSAGLTVYGSWSFFRYLSERFRPLVVRRAWNRADGSKGGPDDYSLQAVARALAARGASFRPVFADYARANLAPGRYYDEGGTYPSPTFDVKPLGAIRRTTGWVDHKVDHLSTFYLGARSTGSLRADARVQVDAPKRVTGAQAQVVVRYSSGAIDVKRVALNRNGDGAVRVDFGRYEVNQVSVALVNASSRFTHCYQGFTQYSCSGGIPVDDNKPYQVKISLA